MKLATKLARLALIVFVLFLIGFAAAGCGSPQDGTTYAAASSCRPCGNAVVCETTIDDCIVEGDHTCRIGDLTLFSDGISSTYTKVVNGQTSTGTWTQQNGDLVLSDGSRGHVYEDGETCPEVDPSQLVGTWTGPDTLTFFAGGTYWEKGAGVATGSWSVSGQWLTLVSGDTRHLHFISVVDGVLTMDSVMYQAVGQ